MKSPEQPISTETPRRLPELLAPARDLACLQAAVNAGCDAVYLGVEGLNMRQAATNFPLEELGHAANVCRAAGIRLYLVVNTIVFRRELGWAREVLERATGLTDAIICWDPAIISLCRDLGHAIHISTQASVANPRTAAFYRDLGADRIVPARECTLEEVVAIREEAGVEVEVFAHGAMCVNYSGRCFLSQDVFNKSGNRGECLQPCRREYRITDVEDGDSYILGQDYVMSAQDVCTLPFLEELVQAGVDALKIEGRNRNPEYVDTVVRCYRRALDAYAADELDAALKERLVGELSTVFNREFSSGFYHGRPIASFARSRGNQATHRKEYVGRVTNYYSRLGVVEVEVQSNTFPVGAELMIQGSTTGVLYFQPREIRRDGEPIPEATRGVVTIELGQKVREGDKVYLRVPREGKRAGE